MNKGSRGFLGVLALFVLLVISIVGGTGFYIFSSRKNIDNNKITVQNFDNNTAKLSDTNISRNYKQYDDATMVFDYPDTWTTEKRASQPEWVFFTSHDYRAQDVGPSTVVQAGNLLEIKVTHTGTNAAFEQSLKNAQTNQNNTNEEIIQIDGHNSLLNNTGADNQSGTFIIVATFVNGKTYYIRFSGAANAASETRRYLNTLLASMKLK